MIHFGRSDFVSDIDNEALDFEQLEAFIHNNSSVVQQNSPGPQQSSTVTSTNGSVNGNETHLLNNQTNLPESPPDSGSEPPYSPNNLQKISLGNSLRGHGLPELGDHQQNNQNLSMEHLTSLTELHVPHHLLANPGEIYLTNDHHQQQQLLHLNNLLQNKHDPTLLSHHPGQIPTTQQEQMLMYQVAQNGQLIEINHLQQQQQQQMSSRLYKNELMDLDQSGALPAIQDIQSRLTENLSESLQLMNDSYARNQLPQEIAHTNHALQAQPPASTLKKRKVSNTAFLSDSASSSSQDETLKSFIKTETKLQSNEKLLFNDGSSTKAAKKNKHLDSGDETPEINSNNVKIDKKKNSSNQQESNAKLNGKENFQENSDNKSNSNFLDGILAKSTESLSQDSSQIQCIRFSAFQQPQWHLLYDHNHQELTLPHFRVDADKGFNFSNSDDAFVCQKKNHFQITCHVQLHGNAVFVKTPTGLEKIRTFHIHFYGVKLEAPAQTIRIEQSQSDRSKKPFYPVLIELQNGQIGKVTVGRLHFSETTCNNMRKKGRPNPEQRYFQLVVGLHAHTYSGYYPIISHASERIIVRASNPGQFDSDIDLCCWQRGTTQNSIFHQGKIGINHDHPDESLVINGNIKLIGHIIQPSDFRIKNNIQELNPVQQLENINQIRIVKYQYDPTYAEYNELNCSNFDTGIIAQEVQKVLPDAVHNGGNIRLTNGVHIDNFLQINKDRLYMENIGAVKQLSKLTDNLEKRIENLENYHNSKFNYVDKVKFLQFFMILLVFFMALWY